MNAVQWFAFARSLLAGGRDKPRTWTPRRVRVALLAVAAAGVVAVLVTMVAAAMSVQTALVAAPAAVAGSVLGTAAEVLGGGDDPEEVSGQQLAGIGQQAPVNCDAAPAASVPVAPAMPAGDRVDAAPDTSGPPDAVVTPIPLREGGSIGREDIELLIAPIREGESALKAHVWFLYRLAGLGDWDTFNAAYTLAELRSDETGPAAPLRQVQELNPAGADVGRYRLTAAALVSAGEQTGRLRDPYPEYREFVAVELLGSCLGDSDVTGMLAELPPPGR